MGNFVYDHMMTEAGPDQVMVKITSNFPKLFNNAQKYSNYINYLLNSETQSQFFLEIIEKGVIYIFRNFEILKGLNAPLTKRKLKQLNKANLPGAKLFLEGLLSPDNFPPKGVKIFFDIIAPQPKLVNNVLFEYFKSYLSPNVQPSQSKDDQLMVQFLTYESLSWYAERLGILLQTFVSLKKSQEEQ